jgi:hypothetical protein
MSIRGVAGLLLAAAIAGCGEVSEPRAIELAKAFMLQQPNAAMYWLDSITVSSDQREWLVAFLRTDHRVRHPETGLVGVAMRTGQTRWIPQR